MPFHGLHHVGFTVPDLAEAERYYRELFEMAVLFREGVLDGRRGTVPDGVNWATATAHGVEPHRSVLGRDEIAIALAASSGAEPSPGGHIAIAIDLVDLGPLTRRAASMGCGVEERETGALITDRYGREWELTASGFPPTSRYDTLEM